MRLPGPRFPIDMLRGNGWMLVTALAVMGGLAAAGALVLHVADREDAAREAQVLVAQAQPAAFGLYEHPRRFLHHSNLVTDSELTVNRGYQAQLLGRVAELRRAWPGAMSAGVHARSARLAELSGQVMSLLHEGRLGRARRLHHDLLGPVSNRLQAALQHAQASLQRAADDTQRDALTGTLAITGVIGGLLVLVVFRVTAIRRRHEQAETEERVLAESEQRLQALVKHGSNLITVAAPDTTVAYQAGAVGEMLGRDAEELVGTRLTEWVEPEDADALAALCAGGSSGGLEIRMRHRDGRVRTCEARATSLLDHPLWHGVILNIWDVSDRKALEERLRHQAFHDPLTGLANRALFTDRLGHALARARRSGGSVDVLLIDLDDFKSVNDSLGHHAGDGLLLEVAKRMRECLRAADTVARLGGDEFGVILTDDRPPAGEDAAARILAALASPFDVGGRRLPLTASVGVVTASGGDTSADRLIRDADLAMYDAKSLGKGRASVYHPDMHLAIQERLELKADLADAISLGGQLELHYQPIVSLGDSAVVGLEALVRWNHPTRGQIPPSVFIPLAEDMGSIVTIGRWVVHEACTRAAAWTSEHARPLMLAVNVSARQLEAPEVVDDVRQALAASGLDPQSLVLEVTESEVIRRLDVAVAALCRLKSLGVRVAIDDFGTGYSSLSQLKQLPIDIIKVDRSFADALPDEESDGDSRLMRAVLEIGESLELETIAEGIETPEQLEALRSFPCHLGQGFLFAHPMPDHAIDELLRREAGARRPPPVPPPVAAG